LGRTPECSKIPKNPATWLARINRGMRLAFCKLCRAIYNPAGAREASFMVYVKSESK
jgi:hypothetical protein